MCLPGPLAHLSIWNGERRKVDGTNDEESGLKPFDGRPQYDAMTWERRDRCPLTLAAGWKGGITSPSIGVVIY